MPETLPTNGERAPVTARPTSARYRALIEASTQLVLIADREGAVHVADRSWVHCTGQSAHDARGSGWQDAIHPHDRGPTLARYNARVAAPRPFTMSCRVWSAAHGEYRLHDAHAVPVVDRCGTVREWVVAFSDIHERYVLEHRATESAARFRKFVASNIMAIGYGVDQRIVDGNRAFLDLLGATRSDLRAGLPVGHFISEDSLAQALRRFARGEAVEYEITRLDGSTAYVLAAGVDLAPDPGWLVAAVDLTDRKRAEQEALHLALHDALTGLPNTRLLSERLEHALARRERSGGRVGILFCDLDRFKEINDVHGHGAGDHVLKIVAQRLQRLLRQSDTVARVGGDEFVVLLEELHEPADATLVAAKIRSAVRAPITYDGADLTVTMSIGVVLAANDDRDALTLLSAADDAMYCGKADGGGDVVIAFGERPANDTRQTTERWLDRHLNQALAAGTLDLAFQPVIDLRDDRPVATEALLRWSVDGQPVETAKAIEVAERTGSILRLSDWVMNAACRRFAGSNIRRNGDRPRLHINVSARDLVDERFVHRVLDAVRSNGCRVADVCLEVTETAIVGDSGRARDALGELRDLGCQVAIDDFGTGYASLTTLCELPADVIKIDKRFVHQLTDSPRHFAIVRRIVQLAHDLGLAVIAEGVETAEQAAALRELGCDAAQGYVFAKPAPLSR